MRGHLYCSSRCARDAGRAAVWQGLRRLIAKPVPARIAIAAVLAALAAPGMLAVRAVVELERLGDAFPGPPLARRGPAARIDSVVSVGEGFRVEGAAPEGTAVFLFAGARFLSAVPAAAGRFRFDNVRERGPYRVGAMLLAGTATGQPPALSSSTDAVSASAAAAPVAAARNGLSFVPDFTRGRTDRRELLISFDAGSSDRGALDILEALRQRAIRTTIFLTGDFIRRNPAIVRRIAADGHEVGNHTDTHPHLTTFAEDGRQATRAGVDRAFVAGQLGRAAALYRETTGREMARLWRAPFGEQNGEIRRWAAEAGYWHVGWTGGRAGLDGLDWVSDPRSPAYRSADRVVELLLDRAENGGIVLLHLGSDREDPVAVRIPVLLDGLTARGFRFARATELLDRVGWDERRLAALAGSWKRNGP